MASPQNSELVLSRLTPEYRFNPALGSTGRYINARGQAVSKKVVLGELEKVIAGSKDEITNLSKSLVDGRISIADWQTQMRDKVKVIHNANAAVAKGGWANMTPSDWGRVGSIDKKQYAFLQNFAIEIETGKQKLNGSLLRRAGMYADAGRGTFADVQRIDAGTKEFTEERRILNPADHCSDCEDYEALGWQPLGTLPRIGESICRTNCHCEFEFR